MQLNIILTIKKNRFSGFLSNQVNSSQDLLFLCSLKITGPIVQWIECKIPVLMIRVRIPVGSPKNSLTN